MDFEHIKIDGHVVMVTGVTFERQRDPRRELGKVEVTVTPVTKTDEEPGEDDQAKIRRLCERVVNVANKLGRTSADPAPVIGDGVVTLTTDVTHLKFMRQRGYVEKYAEAVVNRLRDSLVETNDSRELVLASGGSDPKRRRQPCPRRGAGQAARR